MKKLHDLLRPKRNERISPTSKVKTWHPTDNRRGERVRDVNGVHALTEHELEIIHGMKRSRKV